jgi:hypothetical protein
MSSLQFRGSLSPVETESQSTLISTRGGSTLNRFQYSELMLFILVPVWFLVSIWFVYFLRKCLHCLRTIWSFLFLAFL